MIVNKSIKGFKTGGIYKDGAKLNDRMRPIKAGKFLGGSVVDIEIVSRNISSGPWGFFPWTRGVRSVYLPQSVFRKQGKGTGEVS